MLVTDRCSVNLSFETNTCQTECFCSNALVDTESEKLQINVSGSTRGDIK